MSEAIYKYTGKGKKKTKETVGVAAYSAAQKKQMARTKGSKAFQAARKSGNRAEMLRIMQGKGLVNTKKSAVGSKGAKGLGANTASVKSAKRIAKKSFRARAGVTSALVAGSNRRKSSELTPATRTAATLATVRGTKKAPKKAARKAKK